MAYTITTFGTSATVVGTDGSDILAANTLGATTAAADISSFGGADVLTLNNPLTGTSRIGTGGADDTLTLAAALSGGVTVGLGSALTPLLVVPTT